MRVRGPGHGPLVRTRFAGEVAAAGLPSGPGCSDTVTETEIAALPEPVQRYLRRMGVIDAPRVWSFRLHCTGRFRPALDAEWKPAESWQYNSALDVARIYQMKLQFYGVPVVGRDIYLHGVGHLSIRPLDLVTVQHDTGPELDHSELVTWLSDAVLFAPSMLLGAHTAWRELSDDSFEVQFRNGRQAVSARVILDADGAPLEFEASSRSRRDPRSTRVRRARWSTPIHGWQMVNGRRIPTRAHAVWQLPVGDFAYAELEVRTGNIEFNILPGIAP